MDNMKKIGVFVMLFVMLLIGMALFDTLADSVYDATNLQESDNETLTFSDLLANQTNTTSVAQDDVDSVSYFANLTDDLTADLTTGINFTKAGVITIDRAAVGNNNTFYITYGFESDEYVAHSTSRVLVRLINIFFALAIFAAAIYAVYAMGLVDLFKGNK